MTIIEERPNIATPTLNAHEAVVEIAAAMEEPICDLSGLEAEAIGGLVLEIAPSSIKSEEADLRFAILITDQKDSPYHHGETAERLLSLNGLLKTTRYLYSTFVKPADEVVSTPPE